MMPDILLEIQLTNDILIVLAYFLALFIFIITGCLFYICWKLQRITDVSLDNSKEANKKVSLAQRRIKQK